MKLQNKTAIVFGGGGSLGGAVAIAFASEGAHVIIAGHRQQPLDRVAALISSTTGSVETYIVDALDEKGVNDFFKTITKRGRPIDICFNAIDIKDVQGKDIVDMKLEDFLQPINIAMRTQFITSAAAARYMIGQGSGVILSLTASPSGRAWAGVGGFGPACSAMEGFSRNLAAELSPKGIRVVGIRSAGSPDSDVFLDAVKQEGSLAEMEIGKIREMTMLGRMPLMKEIASVAVFLVSDDASGMTGTFANVTCGTTRD